MVESGVNTQVESDVNGFKDIKLIHAKKQLLNQKRIIYLQIKQLAYSNVQTAGVYAVHNIYLKSPIRLNTLVNNSF